MKPIISTKGKLAQLRYELPHRVHDSVIYPVAAPNGSTIVLYALETGVGILWRGGRPLKNTPPPKEVKKPRGKVNGTASDVIMIIDSDDEDTPKKTPAPPPADFEDEDEELDPDQPYPSVIQHLRLALNVEVLHIAVPSVPPASTLRPTDSVPLIFNNRIVFTVTCADFSTRVITLPLSPPSNAAKQAPLTTQSQYGEEVLKIPSHAGHQSIPRGVTMTWTSRTEPTFDEQLDEQADEEMDLDGGRTAASPGRSRSRGGQSRSRSRPRGDGEGWDLLVATHSTEVGGMLKIWRLNLSETSVTAKAPISAYQTLTLPKPATKIAFNSAQYPKRRHSQILITDSSGIARVYDPFARPSRKRRAGAEPEPGGYIAIFRTTFQSPQNDIPSSPVLAARKAILDAAWASDGNSILAILEDGEWGIWDVSRTGPNPPSDPSAFSVRGFVGAMDESRLTSNSAKPQKGRSGLAPMTPNTRRTREKESLFQGTSLRSTGPTRGGISIASLLTPNAGTPEDSVVLWYGSDVYRIPNLTQFVSRTVSGGAKPTLSKVQGLTLHGEAITSMHQFDTTTRDARMAIPRDVLLSTDHRLIILANAAQPLGMDLDADTGIHPVQEEEMRRTDRALLARGELDLGGMERVLGDMEGSGSGNQSLVLGHPRRVLFASSTS